MASSFLSQAPLIVYLISKLNPKKVLDIGKGFGKYGFLIHEYVGIDNTSRLDPAKSMRELSKVEIDAVEIDEQLLLPHLNQFYNKVHFGNIFDMYEKFNDYDLILMIDVIEHLEKNAASKMLKYFASKNVKMIVATPKDFFSQHLYDSEHEEHISHWTANDFKGIYSVDYQKLDDGIIYLLTPERTDIRGFGNGIMKKIRRIARAIKSEL